MRKTPTFYLGILLIIIALIPELGYSQSVVKPISSKEVLAHFDQLYKVDARLISGEFYQTPLINNSTGHPYFFDTSWKTGSIILDSVRFDSLLIRYDININQLIINTIDITDSYLQLILKKDRISSFTMGDHNFRPYPKLSSLTGIHFCEVLTEGDIDFLLTRIKSLKVADAGLSDYKYKTKHVRSLQMGDQLIPYRGRRTLYKLYPELKTQLREFIRRERLRYRIISLNKHVELVNYCNTLLAEKE